MQINAFNLNLTFHILLQKTLARGTYLKKENMQLHLDHKEKSLKSSCWKVKLFYIEKSFCLLYFDVPA